MVKAMNEDVLFAPIVEGSDGVVEVQLAPNHPGVNDPEYCSRRGLIAATSMTWQPGTPTPTIEYSKVEDETWAVASKELASLHNEYGAAEYLKGKADLGLPENRVPQLQEVSDALKPLTGWSYGAAPGLVGLREFYAALSDQVFYSTQYLRHHSKPLYTPEPDIIHEVIGHANQLAFPDFAVITQAAGAALTRMEDDAHAKFIADVFWFSMEFGVIWESGQLKTYGAGILSSFGEMEAYRSMEIRPLHIGQMGMLEYDITEYQPILFAAESVGHLNDVVGAFFAEATDESVAKLMAENPREAAPAIAK